MILVHTDDTLLRPVHEIALKRNLQVYFEVVREAGPPHMRTFLTKCIVGDFLTEGEGNGKKVRDANIFSDVQIFLNCR